MRGSNFVIYSLLIIILNLVIAYSCRSVQAINQKMNSVKDEDISLILNQKLYDYDTARRNNTNNKSDGNFKINYNRRCGSATRSNEISTPMNEQKNKLDNFKNFNNGPRSEEGFYGFTMQIPINTQ